jgi:bifunctional DNA-binding transcriptional regulator/antitoxin component of YhaV-PrlF toxin-antitoxin module
MGTRITSKGQVTIPIQIRQAAKLAEGTELEWSYDPLTRQIVATRRGARPRRSGPSPFARLRGSATDRRMTTDEIMALTRGDIDE